MNENLGTNTGVMISIQRLIKLGISEEKAKNLDLSRADLGGARLSGADLSGANLSGAYLGWARLSGANLSGANLSGANLGWANLSGANLSGADFGGADLTSTVLDKKLTTRKRKFARACPPAGRHGGRIVYRSARSLHNGDTEYKPGRTYTAPYLSHDPLTSCHPGIYACDTPKMAREWHDDIVKCYVRDGDYIVIDKGIRCSRLRVLEVAT